VTPYKEQTPKLAFKCADKRSHSSIVFVTCVCVFSYNAPYPFF